MKTTENPLTLVCNHIGLEGSNISQDDKLHRLAAYLEHLITEDFNKLISILYRIDVSEEKAKKALATKQENEHSGFILAKLLIEREKEKITYRRKYNKRY